MNAMSAKFLAAWWKSFAASHKHVSKNLLMQPFWAHQGRPYKMGMTFPGWFWIALPFVVGCVVFAVWRQLRAIYHGPLR